MQTGSRRNCLRFIVLVVVLWSIGMLGAWRQDQSLAYGAEGTGEQEEATSSASSQMASEGLASMIVPASEAFREEIASGMERAALSLGLLLDTSDLLCLCRNDITVASAGAAGFETPTDTAAVVHVDLGLVYVSRAVEVRFGDGEHGTRLPGFYAVRLTYGRSGAAHDPGIALLELVGGPGVAALAFPVELHPPAATRRLTACLDLGAKGEENRICLGWSGRQFTVEICVFAPSPPH